MKTVVVVVVVGTADFPLNICRAVTYKQENVQPSVNGGDSTKQTVTADRVTIPTLTEIIHFKSRM